MGMQTDWSLASIITEKDKAYKNTLRLPPEEKTSAAEHFVQAVNNIFKALPAGTRENPSDNTLCLMANRKAIAFQTKMMMRLVGDHNGVRDNIQPLAQRLGLTIQ